MKLKTCPSGHSCHRLLRASYWKVSRHGVQLFAEAAGQSLHQGAPVTVLLPIGCNQKQKGLPSRCENPEMIAHEERASRGGTGEDVARSPYVISIVAGSSVNSFTRTRNNTAC